jgi:hypothetical protein
LPRQASDLCEQLALADGPAVNARGAKELVHMAGSGSSAKRAVTSGDSVSGTPLI